MCDTSTSSVAPAAPGPEASAYGTRTRGVRGDLNELPEPTVAYDELMVQMAEALRSRSMSQSAVCSVLALSPVYFSIWLKNKPMPEATKKCYSAAAELWLADSTFAILDPVLTNTNPSQVPAPAREKPARPAAAAATVTATAAAAPRNPDADVVGAAASDSAAGHGGSAPSGGCRTTLLNTSSANKAPRPQGGKERNKDRELLAAVTTPLLILEEMLRGAEGREMAFQLLAPAGREAESALLLVYATLIGPSADAPASSGAGGAAAAVSASDSAVRVTFRRAGSEAPFACMLPNGSLRAPDEANASEAPQLAVCERPQRYRKTRELVEPDPLMAAALEESRRTAALQPTGAPATAGRAAKGNAELKPHELRKQLLHTLQAMAGSPLELRQHKREAAALEGRCPGVRWTSFCSVCGLHFEALGGLDGLACHTGMHVVHARINRLRREELQGTLQRLRQYGSSSTERAANELRAELEKARLLSKLLPDAGLARALVQSEARLRAIDRARARYNQGPKLDNAAGGCASAAVATTAAAPQMPRPSCEQPPEAKRPRLDVPAPVPVAQAAAAIVRRVPTAPTAAQPSSSGPTPATASAPSLTLPPGTALPPGLPSFPLLHSMPHLAAAAQPGVVYSWTTGAMPPGVASCLGACPAGTACAPAAMGGTYIGVPGGTAASHVLSRTSLVPNTLSAVAASLSMAPVRALQCTHPTCLCPIDLR